MARDITQLHPRLQTIIPKLIEECTEQGVPIKIGECVRTVEEQNDLYAKGRTAPGCIVTYAKGTDYQSQHQWGIACDFYLDMDVDGDGAKADDAFNNADRGFDKVGAIAKSLGLGWGGDWTSPIDRPHLYLPDWGDTASELKKKYDTPDKFKATWSKETATATPVKTATPKKSVDEIAKEVVAGKWGNGDARKTALEKAGYNYNEVQTKVKALLNKKATTTAKPVAKKSVTEIANEVIAGKWGTGNTRKTKLEAAGYNYATVQAKVNEILKGKKTSTPAKKSIEAIAREVIAGKWGNGSERKKRLTQAGYNYSAVQKKVNELL